VPQLVLAAPTELAAVVVAGEEERVGDLATEPAGNVDELDETDDCGSRDLESLAAHDCTIGLDDLRLAVDDKAQRPAHRHHGQGLE
jgi:hypothetical protein